MAILKPPPRLNVRQWADERRYLSPESSAQPGKYRSGFAPFQRAPMEDATDPAVESVTLMCCAQNFGKSTILENLIGFFVDADPAPVLMVQPTVDLAESFSKERLTPMFRDTPSLKGKVADARSRDSGNTILVKSFPGGNIVLVGANSPGGLAGRPRRVVLMDEVDRYPATAGTEGDPCALAERRTESYWNAVLYRTSTPTVKGFSRIETSFNQTDQRRWFCPCPKCGADQVLKWSQVLWGKERMKSAERWHKQKSEVRDQKSDSASPTSDPRPPTSDLPADGRDAIYECESCHAHLTDAQRRAMVLAGEWRATAPINGKRGYHFNGIGSPFKHKKGFRSRLHQMVSGFLEARRGGLETFKTWVNTFLAETFEEETDRLEHGPLLARAEDYTPQTLPNQIILVSAGADVQKDRIEVETIGLGMDDESWGIEKRVLHGDPEQDDVWQDLAQVLATKYTRADGIILGITCTAIDMRHKPQKVRKFCATCGLPRVYPVYGVGGLTPILVTSKFNKHYRLRTFAVNGKIAKDTIFARLRVDEPGPRYLHFPAGHGYDEEHFKQLTAEVLKTKYARGFPVQQYEKIRDRNEALDLRVYWLAALDILKPNLTAIARNLLTSAEANPPKDYSLKPAEKPSVPEVPSVPAPKPARRKIRMGGGFISGWKK
jgi:phage terminase large subunit GpA-like protein